MSTTTAKKLAPSPRPASPQPRRPALEPEVSSPASAHTPKSKETKPEPKTLVEALTTGQAVLLKVRANGTKRSLPYYAEGTEYRVLAHAADTMKSNGDTVDAIAKEMKVASPRPAGSSRGWRWPRRWRRASSTRRGSPAPARSSSTRSRQRRDHRAGLDRAARRRGTVLGRARGRDVEFSGLTKTDALREKWRLWWAQPEHEQQHGNASPAADDRYHHREGLAYGLAPLDV